MKGKTGRRKYALVVVTAGKGLGVAALLLCAEAGRVVVGRTAFAIVGSQRLNN